MSNETLKKLLIATFLLLGVAISFIWASSRSKDPCEYQFIVTDDSVTVYDYERIVGTIKLEGQLDSLITLDNQ
jgi:hypothetical protein